MSSRALARPDTDRTAGLAVLAVVLVVASALIPGPTAAAAAAGCTATSGVTVVVDFGSLGGVRKGCAPGDPSSGLAALHSAGFGTTGTGSDGAGFVCRIDGLPSPSRESCADTPPANAYWSYWHGTRSSARWSYASSGAAGSDPAPGTVEGWSFGAGGSPNLSVAAALPATHTSRPTGDQGGGDGGHGSGGGEKGGSTGGRDGGQGSGPSPGTSGGSSQAPSASPTSGRTPTSTAATTPAGGRTSAAASTTPAAANGQNDQGGGLPPAATIGVLAAIWAVGAAAGVVAWRRRRRAS